MTCHCIGCNKTFISMQYYEHCDDCNATFQTKEAPVPCPKNCTSCIPVNGGTPVNNELSEAKLRNARLREELVYQTKFRELYEKSNKERGIENDKLHEENENLRQRSTEQNDWLVRLQEENKKFKTENDKIYHINCGINHRVYQLEQQVKTLEGDKTRYQQEITDLEADYEKVFETLHRVRNTLLRCSDDIYSTVMVD